MQALVIPATSLSAIALEAYKKFVLVSLIYESQASFPRHTAQVVQRLVPTLGAPYKEFADAFSKLTL